MGSHSLSCPGRSHGSCVPHFPQLCSGTGDTSSRSLSRCTRSDQQNGFEVAEEMKNMKYFTQAGPLLA